MPVLFPDNLKHNNDNRPILDLGNNQVKGMGIFASVSDRDNLDSTIRTDGFLALTQVDSEYKAFVYTGNTWGSTDSWTEIGTGASLPSGANFSILVRDSSNNAVFDESPRASSFEVFNSAGATAPSVVMTRTTDSSGVAQATASGDILGEFRFRGHDSGDVLREAGIVRFVQSTAPTLGHVNTKVEIGVGNSNGVQTALTINEERVLSIQKQSSAPSAVEGGFYADTSDNLYFGVS